MRPRTKTPSQRARQAKRVVKKKSAKEKKAVRSKALSTKKKLEKAIEIRNTKGLLSAREYLRDNGVKTWDKFY